MNTECLVVLKYTRKHKQKKEDKGNTVRQGASKWRAKPQ